MNPKRTTYQTYSTNLRNPSPLGMLASSSWPWISSLTRAPPSYQPIEGVLGILQFPLIAQNNKSSLTTSKEQAPPAPLQQKQHQAPPLLLEPPDLLRVYLQLPALHSAPPAAPAQGTPPPIRAARHTTSAPKLCYDSGREPEHHHRGQVSA